LKDNKLRLLIVGDKTRFIHLKQITAELEKIGIESKLIHDIEFIDKLFDAVTKNDLKKIAEFIGEDTAKFLVYSTYVKSYILHTS